jgi:Zn-dependent peptidase ImmA (M78 family)/transcriptional regulator with XRE-family HTH domain
MIGTFANLQELREKLLGYRRESVARLTGLPLDRLEAIEEGRSQPTVYDLELLGPIYGLDAEALSEEPIQIATDDAIETLACLEEFKELGDVVRARIVAAANAARDARRLQRLNGIDVIPMPTFKAADLPPLRMPAFRRGAEFAGLVRQRFGRGTGPIESVRDFVVEQIPAILLLYADLTSDGPAGITFSDGLRGSTIVLNLKGRNTNPAVRRFSLAHELCHALLDSRNTRLLAVLSGYLSERALDVEQRANAFAVRFICPERVLKKLKLGEPTKAAVHLLEEYGLHYGAARLYLRNEAQVDLPPVPPPGLTAVGTDGRLDRAEAPKGIENFPIASVPPERRTEVARLAARAYADGKLSRDAFADYLALTPADDVERIVDFFGLMPPTTTMVA